jgi:4-hydroxybenzoate polyprenyltransferase
VIFLKALKFFLDLIFIARPVVLVPVWGFALFGFRISSQTQNLFQTINFDAVSQIFLFSLSVAAVYVLNQIADRKVDEDNGGFPLLIKAGISDKAAWIWAIILAGLSVTIPLWRGYETVALLSIFSLALGIVYCFKPFSFSGRPFLDFLSNALGYGTIAFAVGWILGGAEFDKIFLCAMLPYFLMMSGGSISSTLPDYDGDKANKKITTAVFLGKKRAHFLAIFCVLLSAASAFYTRDSVALIASGAALVFYVLYAMFPQNQKLMESCYKVGGGVSMLVIGAFFPVLIVSGFAIVVLSVLYFRIFYNVLYPSLLPAKKKYFND